MPCGGGVYRIWNARLLSVAGIVLAHTTLEEPACRKRKNKPQKLKARLPRGFVDRNAQDIRAANAMMAKIAEVYERYGFDPVETPMFEYTDCLGKVSFRTVTARTRGCFP